MEIEGDCGRKPLFQAVETSRDGSGPGLCVGQNVGQIAPISDPLGVGNYTVGGATALGSTVP